MSDGLEPCPHCGEEHVCLFGVQDDDGPAFAVGCVTEDCPGHVATSWRYITREKAVESWNRRAERTCRYEHIEGAWYKTSCGERYDGVVPPNYCQKCGGKVVS